MQSPQAGSGSTKAQFIGYASNLTQYFNSMSANMSQVQKDVNQEIKLKVDENLLKILHKDEVMKVKFEVDCNPSLGFDNEIRWLDLPEFASVSVLDQPSLFAGKIHAILCRSYKNNVKGRDYYDFLFYMRQKIKPNMNYLRNKLIETQKLKENDYFDIDVLTNMLMEKIESIDFNQVKNDAQKFIFKNENLEYFSKELFVDMIKRL